MYNTNMRKAIFLSILYLSGCASAPRMPVDVSLIPNDCANRHAIVNWLENSANFYQNDRTHEQTVTNIKARIWHIRYHCQPASPGPGHALR